MMTWIVKLPGKDSVPLSEAVISKLEPFKEAYERREIYNQNLVQGDLIVRAAGGDGADESRLHGREGPQREHEEVAPGSGEEPSAGPPRLLRVRRRGVPLGQAVSRRVS